MKEYLALIRTGNLTIKTSAVADDMEKARLKCLKKARSMYSPTERLSMKPFIIERIEEI